MKYLLIMCLVVLNLESRANAKNLIPYEPGMTRGCNWSGDEPAPDLIGLKYEEKYLMRDKAVPILVTGSVKSRFFHKGYIADQDSKPCHQLDEKKPIVKLTLSSGKSELESAFVKNGNNQFVPYNIDEFGTPELLKGECVTSKGKFPVSDIGSNVTDQFYDKTACDIKAFGYRGGRPYIPAFEIEILFSNNGMVRLGATKLELTAKFVSKTDKSQDILFLGDWTGQFHPVNEGFDLGETQSDISAFRAGGERPRFQKKISKSNSAVLNAALYIPKNQKPGVYWITFAFMNMLEEDVYVASKPTKLTIFK